MKLNTHNRKTHRFLLFIISVLLASCAKSTGAQEQVENLNQESTQTSTIYLVRHSEKELDSGKDPALTAQGKFRAMKWVEVMQHVKLSAIYSTDTKRTRDTAAPIADNRGLSTILYDGRNPDIELFSKGHKGESIFVVGHSNTVPDIVNQLIGRVEFQELSEKDYDDLFIVTLTNDAKEATRLTIKHTLPQSKH